MAQEVFELEIDVPVQGVQDPEVRAKLDTIKETLGRWAGPGNTLKSSGPDDTVGIAFVRLEVKQCPERGGVAVFPWVSGTYGQGSLSEFNLREAGVMNADGSLNPERVLRQKDGLIYGRPEYGEPYILRAEDGKLVLPEKHGGKPDADLMEILRIINNDPRLLVFLKSIQSE